MKSIFLIIVILCSANCIAQSWTGPCKIELSDATDLIVADSIALLETVQLLHKPKPWHVVQPVYSPEWDQEIKLLEPTPFSKTWIEKGVFGWILKIEGVDIIRIPPTGPVLVNGVPTTISKDEALGLFRLIEKEFNKAMSR
jgi:hypothetical protein